MAESAGALVPRFRGNHVGGPNLLFHLARWTIWQARKASLGGGHNPGAMDGPQRRLLHGQSTEIAWSRARASPLVSLGSIDDVAEWNAIAGACVLLQFRTHRSGRCS